MKRYTKSVLAWLLTFAVTAALIPFACLSALASPWGGGTATPSMNAEGYYLIDSGEKLAWFSNRVNSGYPSIKAKQTTNLDMGSRPFTPIGTSTQKFKGVYNGGGYTISNLKVTGSEEGRGLFGYIAATATTQTTYDTNGDPVTETVYTPAEINDVVLTGAVIEGSKNIGGIAGVSEGGAISGCRVSGTVTCTGPNAGGIVGNNTLEGTVLNCENNAAVSGTLRIGGIAGYCFSNTSVNGCCNTGAISGASYVGGIIGTASGSEVTHSYNKGAITASNNSCGGLVGYTLYGMLLCMYNIGTVSCSGEFTGLCFGNVTYGTRYAKCYYDRDLTTGSDSYATAAEHELMMDDSFLTTLNFAFEIYVGDYFNTNNGYPILRWQLIGWDGSIGEPETDSSGTYLITSGSELAWFARLVNGTLSGVAQNRSAKGKVMRDILLNPGIFDETSNVWTPIGTESSPFIGTFDGGEYRISGIYLPDNTVNYTGLFGCIGTGGTVKNIFLDRSKIVGYNYSGAIAASNEGTIENCFNYSSVQSMYYTGGIAGSNTGTIRTSGNVGDVDGGNWSGGVTGANNGGSVISCFNKGKVTGMQRTGGVIGTNYGAIQYCYNNGLVDGGVSVGGLVGYQNSADANGFTNCYNIGYVKGAQQVGAVMGYFQNGTVRYCYYDSERSGVSDTNATPKTTAQMAEPTSISAFTGFSSTYWVDRGMDQYFDYCPELKVFYNSTNSLLKNTSKESAAVLKGVYTVMAEVDGEMNTYYASVKLGASHIGTGDGTLVVLRDSTITDTATITGSVTVTDNAQTRTLTRGASYTGSFFTVSGSLTLVGTGTDKLCLNGGGSSASGSAPISISSTGTVTMQDGVLITANTSSGNGGGVLSDGGTLLMQGGKISGNTAQNGGGIYMNGGVLYADGGTVSGNTAQNGGGVYLLGTGAEVELRGLTVSGNTAQNGGGVYNQNSTVLWSGGTASGNTATVRGGAFYNTGKLQMSGGTVSGNTAPSAVGVYQGNVLEFSEGVYLDSTDDVYLPSGRTVKNTGRLTADGLIASLTAANYTAGTQVLTGDFCAANYAKYLLNVPSGATTELHINSSGKLIAKEIHNVAKVSVFGSYDVYYTSLKEAVDAIGTETGLITMIADDSVEETIEVRGNVTVTIVGENTGTRTITRYQTCTGAMFTVASDATLEFGANGTTNDNALVVDGGSALYGTYGTCIVENNGTVRIKDGATLQNASSSGNGAAIRNLGTLEISGGAIRNCSGVSGGAIHSTGTTEITGGTITGSTATSGGALYNTGSVSMQGGSITACSATNGGALYNTGTVAFEGGTIASNTASQNGGGIYTATGSVTMPGGTITVITIDDEGESTTSEVSISGELSGNSARLGGGMFVQSGTGSLSQGAISANSARNGGGLYIQNGSFTVSGGSVASNTATANGAAAYNAGTLTLDSVQIDANNDVYLSSGKTVTVAGTHPTAVLTPSVYTIGTPMLSGSNIASLCSGFTVSNDRFFINTSGLLDTTTLSLKSTSHMTIDYTDGIVTGIDVTHNTVAQIIAQFDNAASSLVIHDETGRTMGSDEAVHTRCTIRLLDSSSHTLDSKTFVLVGDVDGDGQCNGVDAALVYAYVAGRLTKQSSGGAAAYRAADADNNGTIDATDGDLLRACGMLRANVVQP
ncbi:MAG: hypothetical protein IJT44_13040 [Clostridia bacterium]|nr:hypothetical protein [Clostridia bacterium]